MIHLGNNIDVLKTFADNSIDSIVTDPPYGLSFMGKKWDYDVPTKELWAECLRVLKPGGHLLSFGGTRTYHRLVVAIEDAGFEIRDQIQWLYGSGFPKSQDISKAIDKQAGAEREVISECGSDGVKRKPRQMIKGGDESLSVTTVATQSITAPATPEAKTWQGWGTALKPANEPICVARKPLSESTVAKNVLRWGTGGLNIDGTRIAAGDDLKPVFSGAKGQKQAEYGKGTVFGNSDKYESIVSPQGRWPANIILDEEAAAALDEQSGITKGGGKTKVKTDTEQMFGMKGHVNVDYDDKGGASRFFYVAKASKRERGEGNMHPTVKPIKLMEYLIKLVTPPGGIVLDPFMGSGTTGVAAKNLGFDFVGIEMNQEYFEIAKRRYEFDICS